MKYAFAAILNVCIERLTLIDYLINRRLVKWGKQ